MQHFDAVERVFLRDPRVYRVFVTRDQFLFIYLGSLARTDDTVLSDLAKFTPEQMLSRHALNYAVPRGAMAECELIPSHFLLGHGLFWRFSSHGNKRHTFALHQKGDVVEAVAVLIGMLGESLSTKRLDGPTRELSRAASSRTTAIRAAEAEPGAGDGEASYMADAGTSSPAAEPTWQHSRATTLTVVIAVCVGVSIFVRHGCG